MSYNYAKDVAYMLNRLLAIGFTEQITPAVLKEIHNLALDQDDTACLINIVECLSDNFNKE